MKKPSPPRAPEWTILRLLQWTTDYFTAHQIESPRIDAEILLSHSLGLTRIDLYTRFDQPLTPGELEQYKRLVRRRAQREPVAYIVGEKEFWSLTLQVSPDVLIPRPETECLVEAALDRFPPKPDTDACKVCELGTGSGAIILALAAERPACRFVAMDISPRAVALARANAHRLGFHDRVDFFCGDWFESMKKDRRSFDMILSNPPYIRTGEIPTLQPEISRHEPLGALDGGPEGLRAIGLILRNAPFLLKPGGFLILEMGHDQRAAAGELADRVGAYCQIEFLKDYSAHERIIILKTS